MPVMVDFSPIGDLANTFFQARDNALKRKLQQAELEAPGEIARRQAEALNTSGAPTASQGTTPIGALGQSAPQPKMPTFATMDGDSPSESLTGNKQAFVNSLMPYAVEASRATGIDPRIIVSQAALETGWGRSAPGNNFFGIKSHGQDGGQTLATTEVVNGQPVKVNDSFRTYGSPADSVKGYADFINSNPRYAALKQAQGLDGQIAALQASGYATDPQYGAKIASIARGLPAADVPAPGAQNAQFFVPGQSSAPTQSATPSVPSLQIPAQVQSALQSANPYVRKWAVEQVQKYQDVQRSMAVEQWKLQQTQSFQRQQAQDQRDFERSKPMAVGPEQDLITGDGVTIRQGKRKPIEVNGVLVDPETYQPVYTAPKFKTEVINGRVVHIDENAASAKDITPQGMPQGYRPMTSEEKVQFGIPENTGAMIGPDGKPATLPGTANTTVKLPTVENEYDKGQGQDYSKTFSALQQGARAAIGTKNTLALMDRLTRDPNFYSGWGAEGKLQANQFLASLGMKDPNASAPTEVFKGLVNDVILGKLGGSLGAGISNGDVSFMQSTAPNLTNTKEGNQLLIQFAGRMADRQQQIGQMARDYAKAHGGRIDMGFDDELAKWANANPLFTEQDFQAAHAAAKGIPVDNTPKPARERPLPQGKERVELPKGYTAAMFIADAKAALKTKDRAAVEEELWKRGIDPKRLDD